MSAVFCFGLLVLAAGCAHFLKPEIGATAWQDARVELTAEGVQESTWQTKELELSYSLTKTEDTFQLSGSLHFDRSVTDSFPIAKKFIFKMSFLDAEGRVLQTVDITPLISYMGFVPDKIAIQKTSVRPVGTSYIAFNYFGSFRGNESEIGGDDWDIFYFPYGEEM